MISLNIPTNLVYTKACYFIIRIKRAQGIGSSFTNLALDGCELLFLLFFPYFLSACGANTMGAFAVMDFLQKT